MPLVDDDEAIQALAAQRPDLVRSLVTVSVPHPRAFARSMLSSSQPLRSEVLPGETWQVRGRSRTTFDEMVRMDLEYARTRSLWTDIKILAATPRAMLSGKGAA